MIISFLRYTYVDKTNKQRFQYTGACPKVGHFYSVAIMIKWYHFILANINSVIYWNRIGKPLSAKGIRNIVQKYGRMAGIDKRISSHSLCHTCVTLCLDGGGTIRHAQYLARHDDPKTTIRYDRNRNNLDDHGTDYIRLDA